ncbi:MAG: DUF2807 domain-containing protein [Bacteroidales bacterium]|nr:DUF2807 domain-containing protein [Bacteroidales bacterium]
MKRIRNLLILAAIVMLATVSALAQPMAYQENNSIIPDDVTIRTYELPSFTGIKVGGAFNVYLSQATTQSVKVETDSENHDKVSLKVDDGILNIESNRIRNAKRLNIYIAIPVFESLDASGASTIKGETAIKSDKLSIEASGATNVTLEIYVKELLTEISGAADCKLSGTVQHHSSEISGAASLKAYELETDDLTIEASGAADARVNVKGTYDSHSSGAASIKNGTQARNVTRTKSTDFEKNVVNVKDDSVEVSVGNIKVRTNEDDGSSVVSIGHNRIIVDEDGNVKIKKGKKIRNFDGHWGGFELSLNGYLNNDMNMDFGAADRYLDLYMPKSIGVYLNLFEQNVKLDPSGNFGFITGLGIEWHNYRFDNSVWLDNTRDTLRGYIMDGVKIKKNKLVVSYLTLPLIFEWQHKGPGSLNDYHFGVGAIIGARIGSHTKVVYDEQEKEFNLLDPATNQIIATRISPRDETEKVYDDFHLNPFKVDATLRIGWGHINLFGTYSLTTLFSKNKGPELYPFAVGITLLGW